MNNNEWTAERDRLLRDLHALGIAYGLIASDINRRTGSSYGKSSICGRAKRLQLPIRKPATRGSGRPSTRPAPRPIGPVDSLNVTLIDLCVDQCRYVTGGEGVSVLFCGHRTEGGPYCPWHRTFVYVPVELRIRQQKERNDAPEPGRPGISAQG
jgi:hypothetical protein